MKKLLPVQCNIPRREILTARTRARASRSSVSYLRKQCAGTSGNLDATRPYDEKHSSQSTLLPAERRVPSYTGSRSLAVALVLINELLGSQAIRARRRQMNGGKVSD